MMKLREGITHLGDLSLGEFISTVRNIPALEGTEKLDGANLWFGLDDDGKLFTSREGKRKNADRRYSADDWPKASENDQFIGAHLALEQIKTQIDMVLEPGDIIEIEVLMGSQPNTVNYGSQYSYIAFLSPITTTKEKVELLRKRVLSKKIGVAFDQVSSQDGKTLGSTPVSINFKFITPQKVNSAKLVTDKVDDLIDSLEAFLKEKSSIDGYSNYELATINLAKIGLDTRTMVGEAREELLNKIQSQFKDKVVTALVQQVKKVKSTVGTTGVDVEGVVLSGGAKDIKLVDKNDFSKANSANQAVRHMIQGIINTTDEKESLERQGGIMGVARARLAKAVLGDAELARAVRLKALLKTFDGNSPSDKAENLVKSLNIQDFIKIKNQCISITNTALTELDKLLDKSKEENLATSKVLAYFAEINKLLQDLKNSIKQTRTPLDLVTLLYAKQLNSILTENLFEAKKVKKSKKRVDRSRSEVNLTLLKGKDAFQILNCYFTVVFISMLILKVSDSLGEKHLRDKQHCGLKSWSPDMSILNHWGYIVWHSQRPDIKEFTTKATEKLLFGATRHIQAPKWRFLHLDLSWSKHLKIDWEDHKKTLTQLFNYAPEIKSPRLLYLLDSVWQFETLPVEEKEKVLTKLSSMARQFIPTSLLTKRLIAIQKAELNIELDEAVNTIGFKAGFEKKKDILNGKYTLIATNGYLPYTTPQTYISKQFRIEVRFKNSCVGWVNFEQHGDHLEALDLNVNKDHRRKGLASKMYEFAKELGNDIQPSQKQTALGKLFWSKNESI